VILTTPDYRRGVRRLDARALDEAEGLQRPFPWLEIRCTRCKTPSDVDLAAMKHPLATFVHDLASRLRCRKCAEAGRRPAATLLQLAWQPRHPRAEA